MGYSSLRGDQLLEMDDRTEEDLRVNDNRPRRCRDDLPMPSTSDWTVGGWGVGELGKLGKLRDEAEQDRVPSLGRRRGSGSGGGGGGGGGEDEDEKSLG